MTDSIETMKTSGKKAVTEEKADSTNNKEKEVRHIKELVQKKSRLHLPSLKKQVKELKLALAESQDKHLRLAAEFDNYKKRTQREYLRLVETAEEKLIVELLPVLDNLERAFSQDHNSNVPDEFLDGIKIIATQFSSVLKKAGVEPIESVGKSFDPHVHEAMMQLDGGDAGSGTVVQEIEKGYRLGDKVIRHAKVAVAKHIFPERKNIRQIAHT